MKTNIAQAKALEWAVRSEQIERGWRMHKGEESAHCRRRRSVRVARSPAAPRADSVRSPSAVRSRSPVHSRAQSTYLTRAPAWGVTVDYVLSGLVL